MTPDVLITIIGAVVSLLGGDALLRLLFFRSSKREAAAKAEGVEKQNESAAVETLQNAMTLLKEQLDYANAQIRVKDEQVQTLQEGNAKHLARLQALYDDMCIHKGCKLRKPHQGQGAKWYEDHADDPSLGCDFMSVEYMLKLWRARNAEPKDNLI